MNIPADLPTPDQENVYYSVKSLTTEFAKYFSVNKVKALRGIIDEYYFPTFVFDDNDAPNSYLLRVYPRNGTSTSILIDGTGAVVGETKTPLVAINEPEPKRVQDNGSGVILDPTFYSQAKLKSNDFFIKMPTDQETRIDIDLLIGTKFWYDSPYAQERFQFLEITKNIVKSSFQSLPEEELKNLKDEFDKISGEITATITVLEKISEGQSTSLDSLRFVNQLLKNYKFNSSILAQVTPEFQSLQGTKHNVAQSIHDLVMIKDTGAPGQLRKGLVKYSGETGSISKQFPVDPANNMAVSLQRIYDEAVSVSKQVNPSAIDPIESIKNVFGSGLEGNALISNLDSQVGNILSTDNGKEFFGEDGWLKTWYYDNFSKKINDEEADFSGLDKFLENFRDVASRSFKAADRDLLSGERLLVYQAILKSILKLCQSNLDVSKYSPELSSGVVQSNAAAEPTTIYERMQRSPILGPTQTHQYPSRFSQPKPSDADFTGNEYKIESFSKPGFLCYGGLLAFLNKIRFSNGDVKNFIKNNVGTYDSDHESTIALWKAVFGSNIVDEKHSLSPLQSMYLYTYKDLMNLHSKNEEWASTTPLLIPRGDHKVGSDQRSFFNYYIPPISNESESWVESGLISVDFDGMKKVSGTNADIIDPSGSYIHSADFPQAWERMGYGGTQENGSKTIRTVDVHYGISKNSGLSSNSAAAVAFGPDGGSVGSTDVTAGSTLPYWKHKNYNMPYFWASCVSINKALVYEAYSILLESISSVLGIEIEIDQEDYNQYFDLELMWDTMISIAHELHKQYGNIIDMFPSPDGSIIFRNNGGSGGSEHSDMFNENFWNTTGYMTISMVNKYTEFIGLISSKSKIVMADDFESVEFDSETYLPPEVMAVNTNQNFKNGHGGFGAYRNPEFEVYYDPLVFKKEEFLTGFPLLKNTTPIGENSTFIEMYSGFLQDSMTLRKHVFFLEDIIVSFNNFREYIQGFKIGDVVKGIFQEGHFDPQEDIKNPQILIGQIENNLVNLGPSSQGISRKWERITSPTLFERIIDKDDTLYVYILGLKENLWKDKNKKIKVVPEYFGTGKKIVLSKSVKVFDYLSPTVKLIDMNPNEQESKALLDYLHINRGIHVDEMTFSKKTDRIYSDLIVNSESEVFPWVKDDFEENKPKKPIDSLYNISPWMFPRNYFYDVCLENEYQRVVAVSIKKSDLGDLPIEMLDPDTSIEGIIGSIRWVTYGA